MGAGHAKGVADGDLDLPIYAACFPVTQVISAAGLCPHMPADVPSPPGLTSFRPGRRLDELVTKAFRMVYPTTDDEPGDRPGRVSILAERSMPATAASVVFG